MSTAKKPNFKKKLETAQNDLEKLLREVAPFIKKTETIQISTDGKWIDTTVAEVVEKEEEEVKTFSSKKYMSAYIF
jgi:hypothetical protein